MFTSTLEAKNTHVGAISHGSIHFSEFLENTSQINYIYKVNIKMWTVFFYYQNNIQFVTWFWSLLSFYLVRNQNYWLNFIFIFHIFSCSNCDLCLSQLKNDKLWQIALKTTCINSNSIYNFFHKTIIQMIILKKT